MACWVYVLESVSTGRYYVGSTEDVEGRLAEHKRGRVDSTRHTRPWRLVYVEEHSDRSEASRREREIRSKKSRRWIECDLLRRQ